MVSEVAIGLLENCRAMPNSMSGVFCFQLLTEIVTKIETSLLLALCVGGQGALVISFPPSWLV